MRRRIALLVFLPLLVACGSGQPSHLGEYGTQMASTPDVSNDDLMAGMTLGVSDLDGAWAQDEADTHEVTLHQAIQHQSQDVVDRDLRFYWLGYQTRSTSGGTSVLSTVWVYRDAYTPALVALALEAHSTGSRVKAQKGAPGDFFVVPRQGSGSGRGYTATWARDYVVSTTVLTGPGATVPRLMTLARMQDRKVTGNLAAALAAASSH
jgi:hypothetical protein